VEKLAVMPYCLGCGDAISENDRFCNGCGRQTLSREERIYNDLPELGKARVDKQRAQTAQAMGAVGAGAWILVLLSFFNPVVWGSGFFGARSAYRNWKEQNEVILDAELRRERALYSKDEFHTRRVNEERDEWFRTAKKLRTYASRYKWNAITITVLVGGVVLLVVNVSGSTTADLVVVGVFAAIDLIAFRKSKRCLKSANEAQARAEELGRGGRSEFAEECERRVQALS
jgi:hypothetical protein